MWVTWTLLSTTPYCVKIHDNTAQKIVLQTSASNAYSKFINETNKLRGFSPSANYTDRATAACRRS
jgi:hypothetical protein